MTAAVPAQQRREGVRALVRQNLASAVFDLAIPLVLYYGLRALGGEPVVGAARRHPRRRPADRVEICRARRLDLMALFTISIMVFSLAVGLLTDNSRALAVREGWVGALLGLFGLWMVVSVLVRRNPPDRDPGDQPARRTVLRRNALTSDASWHRRGIHSTSPPQQRHQTPPNRLTTS